jgi:peptidoglycan/xylan/chitin deacetylase (PgdA/CDA1 family)
VVALTFDDGPRPEHLSRLLAILDRSHVKATFFFVGVQAEKYPSWVRMTAQAGHEIGNHTYDHLRLPQLPDCDKGPEIGRCQQAIWDITGERPRFVRPPGCELDAATLRAILERGLVVAMYDVNLRDDTPNLSSRAILSSALARVRPGSIILGHSNVEATVDMLPDLISALQARGYRFVTLSELASEATPPRPASAPRGAGSRRAPSARAPRG